MTIQDIVQALNALENTTPEEARAISRAYLSWSKRESAKEAKKYTDYYGSPFYSERDGKLHGGFWTTGHGLPIKDIDPAILELIQAGYMVRQSVLNDNYEVYSSDDEYEPIDRPSSSEAKAWKKARSDWEWMKDRK